MLENTKVPNWAAFIKNARARRKMSQQKLAEAVGSTQSNVAKWERGAYKPAPEVFLKLSRVFEGEFEMPAFMEWGGVPKEYFFGETHPKMIPTVVAEAAIRDAEQSRAAELAAAGLLREGDIRMVPLLADAAAAGSGRQIDEREIERMVPIPAAWLPRAGNLYAIKIKGDSMEPIILEGHIVIVDTNRAEPRSLINKMVVAESDGITVKWLREDDGDFLLVPQHVSVRHPVHRLRKGMRIVGEVVKWIGEPPPPPKR